MESVKQKREVLYLGKTIRIITMKGESHYHNRIGVVKSVDDMGQLHGTWGSLAVLPEEDDFEVIEEFSQA